MTNGLLWNACYDLLFMFLSQTIKNIATIRYDSIYSISQYSHRTCRTISFSHGSMTYALENHSLAVFGETRCNQSIGPILQLECTYCKVADFNEFICLIVWVVHGGSYVCYYCLELPTCDYYLLPRLLFLPKKPFIFKSQPEKFRRKLRCPWNCRNYTADEDTSNNQFE